MTKQTAITIHLFKWIVYLHLKIVQKIDLNLILNLEEKDKRAEQLIPWD